MKRIVKATLLTSLMTAGLMAQRPFGALTTGSPPDPATMVANQVSRLTSLLSLSASQAAAANTIFTNAQAAISPLETTLNTSWTSMQAAIKANATTTIDQLSTSIGVTTGQITAIQNKADAAFYALLTADQKTKLDATGGFGGRGPGGGRPGGRGPRP
jgi:hypothetical protein